MTTANLLVERGILRLILSNVGLMSVHEYNIIGLKPLRKCCKTVVF